MLKHDKGCSPEMAITERGFRNVKIRLGMHSWTNKNRILEVLVKVKYEQWWTSDEARTGKQRYWEDSNTIIEVLLNWQEEKRDAGDVDWWYMAGIEEHIYWSSAEDDWS